MLPPVHRVLAASFATRTFTKDRFASMIPMKRLATSLVCLLLLFAVTGCNSDRRATARAYQQAMGPEASARMMQDIDARTKGKSSMFLEQYWPGERRKAEGFFPWPFGITRLGISGRSGWRPPVKATPETRSLRRATES